jgi:hypothetical protein
MTSQAPAREGDPPHHVAAQNAKPNSAAPRDTISDDAADKDTISDVVAPQDPASEDASPTGSAVAATATRIAGLSALKGLVLYGAVTAFASVYVYFIVKIFDARAGKPPTLATALVSAAAALAGVLGSAFALEIGTPTDESSINLGLCDALQAAATGTSKEKGLARLRQVFSLEPPSTQAASWPKTFGIWVYALVGSAVALTYVVRQNETPGPVRALAVAFGGYVIALVTAAYGITTRRQQ